MTNPIQHIFSHLEQQEFDVAWLWHSWWNLKVTGNYPVSLTRELRKRHLPRLQHILPIAHICFVLRHPRPPGEKCLAAWFVTEACPANVRGLIIERLWCHKNAMIETWCFFLLYIVYSIGGWPSCSRDVLWIRKPIRWWQKNWLHSFMVSFITDVLILSLPQIAWYSLAVNHALPSWRGLKCH